MATVWQDNAAAFASRAVDHHREVAARHAVHALASSHDRVARRAEALRIMLDGLAAQCPLTFRPEAAS